MQTDLDSLFDRAVAARTARRYWSLVGDLQKAGTNDVFDHAARLLKSSEGRRRQLGADVLGELGFQHSRRPFRQSSARLLKTALRSEADSSVLVAIVRALSRLNVRSAIPLLVRLQSHDSAEVRFALAAELWWCTWSTGEEVPDARVTATLVTLSNDRDADVRDWATFSLASSDIDTPEVRAALWDRVNDRHFDTRIEALRGLARRRDGEIRERLRRAVANPGRRGFGSWTIDDFVEYAAAVGDRDVARTLSSWE